MDPHDATRARLDQCGWSVSADGYWAHASPHTSLEATKWSRPRDPSTKRTPVATTVASGETTGEQTLSEPKTKDAPA